SIEASVLALEEGGQSGAIDEVFRLFHTLKGNAAALGFAPIEALAHSVEDLLARARAGQLQIGGDQVEVVLAAVDLATTMVRDIEARAAGRPGGEFTEQVAAIRTEIQRLTEADDSIAAGTIDDHVGRATASETIVQRQPTIKVDTQKLDSLVDLVGELVIV